VDTLDRLIVRLVTEELGKAAGGRLRAGKLGYNLGLRRFSSVG
jgi:hypothetical protein